MGKNVRSFYTVAWRVVLVLLTIQVAADSIMKYFTTLSPPAPPVIANSFANPALLIHVVAGVVALLAGPLQFVAGIRSRRPAIHRANGRVYVAACAIGAPSGFILALGTTAGPIAAAGFAIPAVLWPVFTWLGWRAAVDRRFAEHRDWMLRSYAIAATAITLRLMIPSLVLGLRIDFFLAYPVIAWASWSANLLLAEILIRRRRGTTVNAGRLATA